MTNAEIQQEKYNRALINCQSRKLGLAISLLKRILERELHIPLKDRKQYQKELDHIYSIKVEIPEPNANQEKKTGL